MIRFLAEHRVNVLARACDGDSVLYIALRHDRTARNDLLKVVTRPVGYPLEANPRGEIPLHIAAEPRHISAVRYFIAQGASVLPKASNGNTMLHFATGGAESRDGCARDAVKFLVGCGCELATPNDKGGTPLHVAVGLGRIKTTKYLLSLEIPLPDKVLVTAIQSDKQL